ncbi:MAG: hypothetical protein Q9218_001115 [Villophora microphyllina]
MSLTNQEIRLILIASNIRIPKEEVFYSTLNNIKATYHMNVVTDATALTHAKNKEINRPWTVTKFSTRPYHKVLERGKLTLLISRIDPAWATDTASYTTHVHITRSLGVGSICVNLTRFSAACYPSIAVRFSSDETLVEARRVLQAHNLESTLPTFSIGLYQKSADLNTMWLFDWKSSDAHRLVKWAKELLPSASYVPSYMLYEHEVGQDGGLVVDTGGSPPWLLDMIPPSVPSKEWRLTASDRASCELCNDGHPGNEVRPTAAAKRKVHLGKRLSFRAKASVRVFDKSKPPARVRRREVVEPRRSARLAALQPKRRSARIAAANKE